MEKTKSIRQLRAYICPHVPFLRIGAALQFENGFLVTDRIEDQARIEGHPRFGRQIFRIVLDPSGIPAADD